jgi:hypothetical protein
MLGVSHFWIDVVVKYHVEMVPDDHSLLSIDLFTATNLKEPLEPIYE